MIEEAIRNYMKHEKSLELYAAKIELEKKNGLTADKHNSMRDKLIKKEDSFFGEGCNIVDMMEKIDCKVIIFKKGKKQYVAFLDNGDLFISEPMTFKDFDIKLAIKKMQGIK